MKHEFQIVNLNCANCANKIELELSRFPDFENVTLNFMLKKITLDAKDSMSKDQVRNHIQKVTDSIERGVKIVSKELVTQHASLNSYGCYECESESCNHTHNHEERHSHGECHGDTHEHGEGHSHGECHGHTHEHGEGHSHGECHGHTHEHEEGHSHGEEHGHMHNHEACHCHTHEEFQKNIYEAEYTEKHHSFINKIFTSKKSQISFLIISILLMIIGSVLKQDILFIIAYIIVGYDVIFSACKNCLRGRMLDENFLMTIATVAAFIIGQYPEAVAVMIFYKIGEYMQGRAVDYSTKQIEKVMDIRPDFARVIRGKELVVDPKEVRLGEIIEVRPGEKVPLDGQVVEGEGSLNTAALTGESLPNYVKTGDAVLSGSISNDGVIKIKVSKTFGESTVSKILELIQNASSKKSKSENFITKFARWYTPIVVIGALLVAIIPSILTGNWNHYVYISIVFLVISCPCALVVSVPLGFFGGIGSASRAGVLVKGSNYLEELNTIDTIVLDKTGTITKGRFGVIKMLTHGISEQELLESAAIIERLSNHPIAQSIVRAYGKEIPQVELTDYKEISGEGVSAKIEAEEILVGNEKLMQSHQIEFINNAYIGSHVHIARGGQYLGCIIVADEVKEDSKSAISELKKRNIKKVIMLTGDKKEIADQIGQEVGVDEVYAELLPQDKVSKVEEILKAGKVAFIGDGINDAPVLARANIGIAMGGVGSDAAIEASDVVLMTDSLSSVADVLDVAKRTRSIVTQNIVFALGVKVIVLALGLLGIANMWLAIFADVGVSLIAVLNSMRALGKNKKFFLQAMKDQK